jgi:hypothetical protein
VARLAEPGDLVLTMGAGDVTALAPEILAALGGPAPSGPAPSGAAPSGAAPGGAAPSGAAPGGAAPA